MLLPPHHRPSQLVVSGLIDCVGTLGISRASRERSGCAVACNQLPGAR
jgi:hypothetical protein